MNAGLGLAILAIAQLVLAWLADRSLSRVDQPLFAEQARNYQQLKIAEFFSEPGKSGELSNKRIAEVLRLTRLASAARAALTALLVAAAGCGATVVIVAIADPAPEFKEARLAGSIVGGAAALLMLGILAVKVMARELRSHVPGEDLPERFSVRLRCFKVLTPYLATAFLASVAAILSAIGVD